jgi:hypothetical protein
LPTLSLISAILSIILTALWLAHLLVHASKAAAKRSESSEPKAGHSTDLFAGICCRGCLVRQSSAS